MLTVFKEFNETVKQKGKTFQILFYVLLTIYFILFLVNTISSLLKLKILEGFFSLIWIVIMIYLLKKCSFYDATWLLLLQSPFYLLFILLPITQIFLSLSNVLIYLLIAGTSLIFGMVYGFLFNKTSDTTSKLLIPSYFLSIIVSFIFALIKVIDIMFKPLAELYNLSTVSRFLSIYTQHLFNTNIGFVLFFVFFNIPFVKYFLTREDRQNKQLALYLIPILIFIIAYFLFVSIIPTPTI